MSPEVRERLRAIYAEADQSVARAAPRCDASGRCCRFREYGHTLFLCQLEAELLIAEGPAFSGPVSAEGCPFQVQGLCTAREPRPLGCRVYFCDPAYQDAASPIMETGIARLKALADEAGLGWRYAPLHHFLAEHLDNSPHPPPDLTRDPQPSDPSERIPLALISET